MNKTYIIAEIGINHNGDMNLAKELIDMAYSSGCDAVKFQKRTLSEVYTDEELDVYRESPWGTTNRQQKEGLEFSIEEYKELEIYTKGRVLDFIVSCWDIPSIDLVEEHLNVDYHKVASALMTDKSFLRKLVETGKPIIASTGMNNSSGVNLAMHTLGFDNVKYLLACTSTYPTKPEDMNLKYIQTLKQEYPKCKIGFSNHYSGALASHGAIALGAECIEFHITKDRTMYGSDQAASIEHVDVLVKGIRLLEKMVGDGVKVIYEDEKPIASKLRKYNTI
tara:strand:- start:54581 stop:55417 length:837 start_codon:yes stop_codon:yes gene_type:complete